MSKWLYRGCPKCGSSDALSYKEGDEWAYCFSCTKSSKVDDSFEAIYNREKEENIMVNMDTIATFPTKGIRERGITKTVCELFGVKMSVDEEGNIESHYYPYHDEQGEIVAYKQRRVADKKFLSHGTINDSVGCFGMFADINHGGKNIVVTEGEIDALTVAQAYHTQYNGTVYPVLSISSASQTKAMVKHRDYLRKFQTVILWLDSDKPGREAEKEMAKIIGYDKVKVVRSPEKDASDVFKKGGSDAVMQAIWAAQSYNPAGIVRGETLWGALIDKKDTPSVPFPDCLSGVNEKVHGMRLGEIDLFVSGTGSGKSTVIKETVLHLHNKTEDMIGIVSLEESLGDTTEKLVMMHLNQNKKAVDCTPEELRKGFDNVIADGRILMLDHQGSVSEGSLVDKMEQLALLGCKYIFLDHITIAVSEGNNGKYGNEAIDSMMSDLLKFVKKHDVWLGVVSHLRKADSRAVPFEEGRMPGIDDIKGSGAIKQIAFDIIAFARNQTAEDPALRNIVNFSVLKSRYTGITGPAGSATYDTTTGRLRNNLIDFDIVPIVKATVQEMEEADF